MTEVNGLLRIFPKREPFAGGLRVEASQRGPAADLLPGWRTKSSEKLMILCE